MLQKKLVEFFNTNPEATTVFVALGTLFTDAEKATAFLGGVHGHSVAPYSREQVLQEDNSGAGGSTEQQPDGDTNTEDTTGQSSLTHTETGQHTDSGNDTEQKEEHPENKEVIATSPATSFSDTVNEHQEKTAPAKKPVSKKAEKKAGK